MLLLLLTQGNVENWLAELLKVTRQSVHAIIRSASITVTDPSFKLLEFENVFPAQVSLLLLCGKISWLGHVCRYDTQPKTIYRERWNVVVTEEDRASS